MPDLDNFPTAQQQRTNSCWATVVRMINNYLVLRRRGLGNQVYPSDQALAAVLVQRTGDPTWSRLDQPQSAIAALAALGYRSNTDNQVVPTPEEIAEHIQSRRPLLANIGAPPPANRRPDNQFQGGHWLVITGIINNGTQLHIFDPAKGTIDTVVYNNIFARPIWRGRTPHT